jgi:hypothetical protein
MVLADFGANFAVRLQLMLDERSLMYFICSHRGWGSGVVSMAQEADNLVLTWLRDIRATLDVHTAKFVAIDKRFDGVDKRLDTLTAQVTYAFGMAGMANTHVGLVENCVDELADWKKQVERKQAELERRLTRVEEKV